MLLSRKVWFRVVLFPSEQGEFCFSGGSPAISFGAGGEACCFPVGRVFSPTVSFGEGG